MARRAQAPEARAFVDKCVAKLLDEFGAQGRKAFTSDACKVERDTFVKAALFYWAAIDEFDGSSAAATHMGRAIHAYLGAYLVALKRVAELTKP